MFCGEFNKDCGNIYFASIRTTEGRWPQAFQSQQNCSLVPTIQNISTWYLRAILLPLDDTWIHSERATNVPPDTNETHSVQYGLTSELIVAEIEDPQLLQASDLRRDHTCTSRVNSFSPPFCLCLCSRMWSKYFIHS